MTVLHHRPGYAADAPRADWLAHLLPGLTPQQALDAAQGRLAPDLTEAAIDALWHNSDLARAVLLEGAIQAALALALRPGDHLLDLGCGPGAVARLALEAGAASVTGLDRDSEALALARSLPGGDDSRLRWRHADYLRPLAPDLVGQFDLLLLKDVPPDALVPSRLDALLAALRPGGRLLLLSVHLRPMLRVAWDRGFQARLDAAFEAALAHTGYSDGTRVESAWLAARARHDLALRGFPVDFLPPFAPLLRWDLTQRFGLSEAPALLPYLVPADRDALLRLYNPDAADYLFEQPGALLSVMLYAAWGVVV